MAERKQLFKLYMYGEYNYTRKTTLYLWDLYESKNFYELGKHINSDHIRGVVEHPYGWERWAISKYCDVSFKDAKLTFKKRLANKDVIVTAYHITDPNVEVKKKKKSCVSGG